MEVTIRAQFAVLRLTNLNNQDRWFVEINGLRLDKNDGSHHTREMALAQIETYWGVRPDQVRVYP